MHIFHQPLSPSIIPIVFLSITSSFLITLPSTNLPILSNLSHSYNCSTIIVFHHPLVPFIDHHYHLRAVLRRPLKSKLNPKTFLFHSRFLPNGITCSNFRKLLTLVRLRNTSFLWNFSIFTLIKKIQSLPSQFYFYLLISSFALTITSSLIGNF